MKSFESDGENPVYRKRDALRVQNTWTMKQQVIARSMNGISLWSDTSSLPAFTSSLSVLHRTVKDTHCRGPHETWNSAVSLRVIRIRRFWTTVHTYVLSLNDRFAYSTRNQSNRTACIVRASWENLITSQDEHEEEPRGNDETLHAGLYKGHRLGFTERKITESSVERGPEYRK